MLIALVILALGISSVLAFEGFRLHRLLIRLGEATYQTLGEATRVMERMQSGQIELSVPIKHDVPVKMRVPIRHTMQVPIETSIPVCQEVKTTVDVKSLGLSVPLEVTVPLDLTVPIKMTVPIEINRNVAVSTVVPIDFAAPVAVDLTKSSLSEDLARIQADLVALEAALGETLAAAPKFGLRDRLSTLIARRPAQPPDSIDKQPAKRRKGPARQESCPDCD